MQSWAKYKFCRLTSPMAATAAAAAVEEEEVQSESRIKNFFWKQWQKWFSRNIFQKKSSKKPHFNQVQWNRDAQFNRIDLLGCDVSFGDGMTSGRMAVFPDDW